MTPKKRKKKQVKRVIKETRRVIAKKAIPPPLPPVPAPIERVCLYCGRVNPKCWTMEYCAWCSHPMNEKKEE